MGAPKGFPLYHYPIRIVRVTDGDTLRVSVDHGMRISSEQSLRIAGINAPELNSADAAARERARIARDRLASLLPIGSTAYAITHRDGKSFDRYIADVFVVGALGELMDVAAVLLADGFVAPVP